MTDDLVKRLRDGWTEDGICEDFDEDVLLIAADRIEHLERELVEERHSREIAAAKGWEFSDRIKELEFVLSFIANINYGNGPDVTMEHQSWAKRALGEKTDD
jgi:hypothetical protein